MSMSRQAAHTHPKFNLHQDSIPWQFLIGQIRGGTIGDNRGLLKLTLTCIFSGAIEIYGS